MRTATRTAARTATSITTTITSTITKNFALALLIAGCAGSAPVVSPVPRTAEEMRAAAAATLSDWLADCVPDHCGLRLDPGGRLDSIRWQSDTLTAYLNRAFAQAPLREGGLAALEDGMSEALVPLRARVRLRVQDLSAAELIPNAYRTPGLEDELRRPASAPTPRPVVRSIDTQPPTAGLFGRHVAIWPSHGWYYERTLDRWEWQRARLFGTVEDLLPMAFVQPYVAPMLERAGAHVWIPRERDPQVHRVVVDADSATGYRETGAGWQTGASGFAPKSAPLGDGENPFLAGTHRFIETHPQGTATAVWQPTLAEAGEYAVYLSWGAHPNAATQARYEVRHAGGTTRLEVDQSMASKTWVYAGTWRFAADGTERVVLSNHGPAGSVVSADAVRFGGGVGNVERNGQTSGRPRFVEAARYAMQYDGMPASLVYNVSDSDNDYADDYRGRAEWVNYLKGGPFGPNKDRATEGLGVPVDLSIAFHTDAGVTPDATTIGTLSIYSREGTDTLRVFPDAMSRLANRDLADIIQSEIVRDIHALHDSTWRRRSIWDRDYSEAVRPNVPSMLLELLSHQNFADMQRGLDPVFRSDVSRAIYKGILRFLAAQYGTSAVVQPLPPTHVAARFMARAPGTVAGRVSLTWQPQPDPLEPTAEASGYRVYIRRGNGGFDEGRYVTEPRLEVESLDPGVAWGFRVAAINEGGESAPSETVAAGWLADRSQALVINGFDRVSAPAQIDIPGFRGFLDFVDHGVTDGYSLDFVGPQHDFDPASPWLDDDAPGHGASYGAYETWVIPGNTHDFIATHGEAILAAGFGFDGVSDEAVETGSVPVAGYPVVDYLLGEERETTPGGRAKPAYAAWNAAIRSRISDYLRGGGRLFVSGSYVASDLAPGEPAAFGKEWLGLSLRSGHAAMTGAVVPAGPEFDSGFRFRTERSTLGYAAEAPDALKPEGSRSETLLRYGENNMSAATGYRGTHRVVAFGFPFETIETSADRNRVMRAVLAFLLDK